MFQQLDKTKQYNKFFSFCIFFLSFTMIGFLSSIILFIVSHGINYLSPQLLFLDSPLPIADRVFFSLSSKEILNAVGGVRSALVGTIFIIGFSGIIAIPFGILIAIYLSQNTQSKLSFLVLLITDTMQGIPSIIFGIISYIWIVERFKSYSGFSGSIALAIMMLPIIIKNSYEVFILIPKSLTESALALGTSQSRVLFQIILPSSLGGIYSGILLALSRIIGETAPLLFTAFGSLYFTTDISRPMDTISMQIYRNALSPNSNLIANAWVSSISLMLIILFLNLVIKPYIDRFRIKF